jgi:hypothetical protein
MQVRLATADSGKIGADPIDSEARRGDRFLIGLNWFEVRMVISTSKLSATTSQDRLNRRVATTLVSPIGLAVFTDPFDGLGGQLLACVRRFGQEFGDADHAFANP